MPDSHSITAWIPTKTNALFALFSSITAAIKILIAGATDNSTAFTIICMIRVEFPVPCRTVNTQKKHMEQPFFIFCQSPASADGNLYNKHCCNTDKNNSSIIFQHEDSPFPFFFCISSRE